MSGVEIRVRSDSRQARNDLGKLERSVGNIEKSAFNVGKAFKSLAISGAFLISLRGITRSLSEATDSFTNLENKIALVTGRGVELDRTLKKLSQVSASTRVGLNTTAETFNRFGLALQGTKVSADELLEVTRTINQAVKISGASAESARAAIIQFGQGLASGQLRGQELNSVLEQTPRIARAIADGIGIPFGQLRDAAAEGKLTTDAVLKAIQQAAPEIRAEFALIRETIEDVSLRMRSQFRRAIRVLADETGWADFVIAQMKRITFAFEVFANVAPLYLLRVRAEFYALGNGLSRALSPITNAFNGIKESLSGITTGEFDATKAVAGFKSSWNKFTKEARKLVNFDFINEETNNFDFTAFLDQFTIPESFKNSFKSIETFLTNFTTNIKSIYDILFGKAPKSSAGSSIITPISFKPSEVNEQKGLFDQLLDTLTKWSGSVISIFLSVEEALKPTFTFITELANGTVLAIKDSDNLLSTLKTRISTTSGLIRQFVSDSESLQAASTKIKSIQELILGKDDQETASKIKKATKQLDTWLYGSFDEFGDKVPGAIENGLDKIKDNPLLSGALVGGLGLGFFFPETTLAALKLAGIGFGLAAVSVMAAAFKKGLPIALVITGLSFLDANNEETQEIIRKFGEDFSSGVKSLFTDSGETALKNADKGGSIWNNLGKAFESLGEGILEGIFNRDFEDGIASALVGALSVGIGLAVVGFGPAKFALGLIGTSIIGGIRNSETWKGFKTGFLDELLPPDKDVKKRSEQFGKGFAKFFRFGMSYGLGAKGTEMALDMAIGEPDTIGEKFARAFTEGAVGGLAAAASTGVGANPLVMFGAAIAGGLGNSILLVFTDPEITEAARDLGRKIWEGFSEFIFGKPAIEIDPKTENLQASRRILSQISSLQDKIEQTEKRLEKAINPTDKLIIEQRLDAQRQELKDLQGEQVTLDIERNKLLFGENQQRIKLLSDLKDSAISINQIKTYLDNIEAKVPSTANLSSNGTTVRAAGGVVRGPGGPKDDQVPLLASNGEYVLQASAVNKLGVGFLDLLNQGIIPQRRAGGGLLGNLNQADSALGVFNNFEALVKSQNLDDKTFGEYASQLMGTTPEEFSKEINLYAPQLNPLLNQRLGNPATYGELYNITGVKRPSDLEGYLKGLVEGKVSKELFNNPNSVFSYLSTMLENSIGQFPIFPNNFKDVPKFAYEMFNLVNRALGYWAELSYSKALPSTMGRLTSMSGDAPVNWESEFYKAAANGTFEAPKGMFYGGTTGAAAFLGNALFGTVKASSAFAKTLFGALTGDFKSAGSGMGNLFKQIGFGANWFLKSFIARSPWGLALKTTQGAAAGGGLWFLKGMLDHYIGNGFFNPDSKLFPIEDQRSNRRLSAYQEKIKTLLDQNPNHPNKDYLLSRLDEVQSRRKRTSSHIFDRLKGVFGSNSEADPSLADSPVNDKAIRNLTGYGLNDFLGQINSIEGRVKQAARGEKFDIYREEIPNAWKSEVWIGEYADGSPIMGLQYPKVGMQSNLKDFFEVYNIALHELRHGAEFAGAAIKNPGIFPNYPGMSDVDAGAILKQNDPLGMETRANEQVRNLSIAPLDTINRVIKGSQGSYILHFIDNLNKDLVKRSADLIGATNIDEFIEGALAGAGSIGALGPVGLKQLNESFYRKALYNHPEVQKYWASRAKKFAKGGYVTGEGGPMDDKIPALLSNTEFVVNAKGTAQYRPILEAINNGTFSNLRRLAPGTPSSNSVTKTPNSKLSVIDQNRLTELNSLIAASQKGIEQAARAIQIYSQALFNVEKGSADAAELQILLANTYSEQRKVQDQIAAYENERNKILGKQAKVSKEAVNGLDKLKESIDALTTSGNEAAQNFKSSFENSLNELFRTGDLGAFGDAILNSFTNEVISSFSKGLTDMLFDGLIGTADKDGKVKTPKILDRLFGGQEELGKTGDVSKELQVSTGEFMEVFKIIPNMFSGIFKSFSSSLSGLFQGFGGGGGGFNPFTFITGFFGKNQGGIVPSTPYSQVGKDSVPTMLTPGEMIIPADKVRSMNRENNNNNNQTVVNLSITGDVSRQTRQEIVKMLPTIASGVNAQNKERNYKYR